MKEALKSFKGYLASNNLKLTQQRLLIFKVFMSDASKKSSEDLLREVQSIDATVSRSTVYRTIKHFRMAGIARCIHHGDGCTCHEPMGNHCSRMVCEHCGKSIPVRNPYIDCLQQETARQEGFTLYRHQTVLYGICSECKKLGPTVCTACTAEKIHSTNNKEKNMTFKSTINSKSTQRDFLKRGFKSMFSNYEQEEKAALPVDTKRDREKRPSSD